MHFLDYGGIFMLKRMLSLFLVLCTTVSMLAVMTITASAATSGSCGDNLTWMLDDEGTLTISGEGEMWNMWNQCPWNKDSITSVIIESGPTSIGASAFSKCYYLTNVNISDSVTSIGASAFRECNNLTSVIIPDGVTSIENCAFYMCSKLENISLPDSVTYIDNMAFRDTAYYNDGSNWENNVLYIGNCLMYTQRYGLYGEYSIKEGTVYIAEYAFSGCTKLQSVVIPNSLHKISNWAFANSGIRKIMIPESVSEIGDYAFDGCTYLYDVDVPNTVIDIGDGAFRQCTSLEGISLPTSISSISNFLFYGCTKLEDVIIPDNITKIGSSAFYNCVSLTEFSVPDSITEIGGSVFGGCENLTILNLGNGITTLTNYGCDNLRKIVIGANVSEIGAAAFDYEKLKDVVISDQNPNYCVQDGVIFNKDKTKIIIYLHNKSEVSYTIPDGVISIEENAFYGNEYISHLTFSDSVKYIEDYAFSDCINLGIIDWSISLKEIGYSAFAGCGFAEVAIPNKIEKINGYTFAGCRNLTNVILPDSLKIIDYSAFEGCTSLISLKIPDGVESIAVGAFNGCASILKVEIGSGLKWIGDKYETGLQTVFNECEALKEIHVSKENKYFSSDENGILFNKDKTRLIQYPRGNTNNNYYETPQNVAIIGEHAFYGNNNLNKIILANGVQEVEYGAFELCNNLKEIIIPNSVINLKHYSLGRCAKLSKIYYAGTVEEWEEINGYDAIGDSVPKIICDGFESKPFINSSNFTKNGTIDFNPSSNQSKPYYNNTVKSNSTIYGDYIIRDSSVVIESGKSLNITGKLIIENGSLYIKKGGFASVGNVEVKSKGTLSVIGEFVSDNDIIVNGGYNSDNGGCFSVSENGKVQARNVSLYDYAMIGLYGKLHAENFYVKTKTNLNWLGSKGELWLKGNFTQKKNGILWWQSGADNFCPQKGFSLILETSSTTHNINFDTPDKSYLYNLYRVRGKNDYSDNQWVGNPSIRGIQCGVDKNSLGYSVRKNDNFNGIFVVSKFKQEFENAVNSRKSVTLCYGIEEFGNRTSDTNNALEKYIYSYIAGMEALYPSSINIGIHTWEEKISVIHDGKSHDIKFKFEVLDVNGQRIANVKYTYGKSVEELFGEFMIANKNELANTIKKYATDTYSGAMAEYFKMPLEIYIKNKNSKIASLIWEGCSNLNINGAKKYVKDYIKKGVDKYLDNVEKSIGTSNYSANALNVDGISNLQSITSDCTPNDTGLLFDTNSAVIDNTTELVDSYLISAIRDELEMDDSEELTQGNL